MVLRILFRFSWHNSILCGLIWIINEKSLSCENKQFEYFWIFKQLDTLFLKTSLNYIYVIHLPQIISNHWSWSIWIDNHDFWMIQMDIKILIWERHFLNATWHILFIFKFLNGVVKTSILECDAVVRKSEIICFQVKGFCFLISY